MNQERLKEILHKIPWTGIAAVIALYMGYDYYWFTTDAASPLVQKQAQIVTITEENEKLKTKIKQANDFLKSLDAKKAELRALHQQLQDMKGTLSETLDVPDFMKTTITEAKKVGLAVLSLKPTESAKKEYYAEQAFDLAFKGVFVQLVVFFDRVANLQKIVRVENFALKPVSSSLSRYVELEGVVQLKVYRYIGSKADTLGTPATLPTGTGAPAAGSQGAGAPGGGR